MAASQPTYNELRQTIARGNLAPVYVLFGEESYYLDRLTEAFAAVIPEDERDFNLYTLYGHQVSASQVDEVCRRFPMMAERVMVILKDAQAMRADQINKLHTYVLNPQPSTVLVICFRDDKAKGKDLLAAVRKRGGVMFESKKLKEYNLLPVIADIVKSKGMHIEAKASAMLRDFIGADVARLHSEVDKLSVVLGPGASVTPEAIERAIGISKDYNNFELQDALANRNAEKAFRIISYFRASPKNHPAIVTVSSLFTYFQNLLTMQFCTERSPAVYAAACGFKGTWQVKNYEPALRNYNATQSMEIIGAIRRTDAMSKGLGSRQNEYDLLYDLIFRILNARGIITI